MGIAMIWMDSAEAKVFQIDSDRIHVEKVVYTGPHSSEHSGRGRRKSQTDEELFFRQLAQRIAPMSYSKLLLMGPGLSVKHFSEFIKSHQPVIAEKIVGVEKVDRLPDSEILTLGRNIFHKYYLFQGMIA